MESLPDELLLTIFARVDYTARLSLLHVNARCRRLVLDRDLWSPRRLLPLRVALVLANASEGRERPTRCLELSVHAAKVEELRDIEDARARGLRVECLSWIVKRLYVRPAVEPSEHEPEFERSTFTGRELTLRGRDLSLVTKESLDAPPRKENVRRGDALTFRRDNDGQPPPPPPCAENVGWFQALSVLDIEYYTTDAQHAMLFVTALFELPLRLTALRIELTGTHGICIPAAFTRLFQSDLLETVMIHGLSFTEAPGCLSPRVCPNLRALTVTGGSRTGGHFTEAAFESPPAKLTHLCLDLVDAFPQLRLPYPALSCLRIIDRRWDQLNGLPFLVRVLPALTQVEYIIDDPVRANIPGWRLGNSQSLEREVSWAWPTMVMRRAPRGMHRLHVIFHATPWGKMAVAPLMPTTFRTAAPEGWEAEVVEEAREYIYRRMA